MSEHLRPPDPARPRGLEARVFAIDRPAPVLMRYYLLGSLVAGPFFPLALLPLYFRYHTLRYRFDDEGVSMRWGLLFRREINLTYARIQDIHLASNLVERWLGLARIEIQTASGSAKAEMTIEGIPGFEELRDFLYLRMRGTRGGGGEARADRAVRAATPAAAPAAEPAGYRPGAPAAYGSPAGGGELAAVLRQVAAELRALRAELGPGPAGEGGGRGAGGG